MCVGLFRLQVLTQNQLAQAKDAFATLKDRVDERESWDPQWREFVGRSENRRESLEQVVERLGRQVEELQESRCRCGEAGTQSNPISVADDEEVDRAESVVSTGAVGGEGASSSEESFATSQSEIPLPVVIRVRPRVARYPHTIQLSSRP
jgi:hypothetical protein